ncbi:MAG: hypothetical protein GY906_02325 [bacterium]|nr:hypothetical protein [bacterium]
MPFTQPWFEVDFGANYAAIGTTGYRLYQDTGADSVARTTVGVVDLGNGAYGVPSVNVPDNAAGIEWDTGGGSPVYAREDVEPYRDRDSIDERTSNLPDDPADQSDVEAAITASETAIRGGDGDDLQDLSIQLDAVAIEANVEGHVTNALDTQGYSAARAILLDNLDAAISTRAQAGDAMALTGATLTAIQALILSDATPFDGADVAATLAAVAALQEFIEGGRDIDFTGSDVLGWQRIERDTSGTLIRRYNLFDENGARINETVSSFIGRQGMISSEVAI